MIEARTKNKANRTPELLKTRGTGLKTNAIHSEIRSKGWKKKFSEHR